MPDSSPISQAASPSDGERRPVVILTNSARFALGQIVATPGALKLLQATSFRAAALIVRHMHGDWGDLCDEDRAENEFATTQRLRILSCYRLVDAERLAATPRDKRPALPTLLAITEADRSVTTLLRPSDY